MSLFMKVVRNVVYPKYRFKVAGTPVNKISNCFNRNFHCGSFNFGKMYMEHENKYAYNILESKGYALSFNTINQGVIVTEKQFNQLLETDWTKKSPSEIFGAFSRFAVYCSEHNIHISDQKFDHFIDNLADSLKNATDEELKSVFYSLHDWPESDSIRTRNYIEVWVALDDECLRRCLKWNNEVLLSYVALFYMINVIRHSDFSIKSLNKLASKAKQLTPGQIVKTLFFVGVRRKSPFDMHNLEIHLKNKFSEFSIDDLAIISMGFFKSKTPLRDPDLVLKMVDSVISNSKTIHEVSLAALLKLIRYSTKLVGDDRVQRLLETLQHEVPRLSVMCNVHLALLGTSTMNLHKQCLNAIAETVLKSISQTRVKDLERLVLTYGTFNLVPQIKDCFFTKVIEELRKPERMPEIMAHGRSFACCVTYLSLLNIFPEDLINIALSEELLEKTYGKQVYSYGREILTLHYMAKLYCKNTKFNWLSEKDVKILAKKYTDYVPNEEYKKQYNITERMVLDIMRVLREHRGGPQYVIGDHIVPHHQRGDIILCDDVNGNPVAIKDMLNPKDFGLLRKPPTDQCWTALVIAGRNALIYGTDQPTGPFISKIRDLEAIGYNAVLVPWSIYTKLETDQEKLNYLNELIKNCRQNKS